MGAASGEMPRLITKHGSPISELVEQIALANIALLIEKELTSSTIGILKPTVILAILT